jgi:outer membrane scaffolding protein for murein synthesis (MipA/OmpV family)
MRLFALSALSILGLSTPAWAQEASPLPSPVDAQQSITVGLGVGFLPDYVGSDDYRIIPAGGARGTIGPVSFATRSSYLYVDFLPRRETGLDFDLGVIGGVNFNRTTKIDDKVVRLLPELDTAVELGGFAGISLHNVTNPYDTLAFRLDLKHDVAGAHKSTVISPNIEFATPLSRTTYVSASTSVDFVADKYARYYFGITPADALVSGLPVFTPDGGLNKWRIGALINQSITGDLTHGFSLWGTVEYSHLTGDSKDSPIVRIRGSASQWLLAAGAAYTWR